MSKGYGKNKCICESAKGIEWNYTYQNTIINCESGIYYTGSKGNRPAANAGDI
jgi:hypothetical protein